MMRATLRVLGASDVASGAVALGAASWLGEELDVGTTAVRIVGALLVVLGVETLALADRRSMAKVTVAAEAVSALVLLDVLVLADPTGTGTAIVLAVAAWCLAAAIRVGTLLRTRTGALAAA